MHSGTKDFPQKWVRSSEKRPSWNYRGKHTNSTSPSQKKEPLTSQSRLLLTVHGLCAVANALSGTFVNVFLWKARQDFLVLGWFTLVNHVAMALTFWLAGKWVKEHNKMNCLRAGVAVSAIFYMLVLWFGGRAVDYYLLLGVIQGMSAGFFWLAFNVVYFEVTDPGNRDRFNGWAGLLGSGAGMVAPWISGYLIVHMKQTSGYRLIFTISLIVFVLGVIVSFFLKKRKAEGNYEWLLAARCLREKGTAWRTVTAALIAQGVREGVFGFMIALLVYVHTGNEMKLGNFSLVTSTVALFSFMFVGRLIKRKQRKGAMLIGAIMIVLVVVPFFWKVNFTTLLIFGVGVGLFFPLYSIPITSSVFDLIGGNSDSVKRREEFIVLRELALNVGRILGSAVFIIVVSMTKEPLALNLLLLGIGSSPLAAWFFMRKVHVQGGQENAAKADTG
ncbi:MFS transporter [Paenibacillus radicis (ex Xue et al. 2023)]|uniref:MFS transporter n=1 Tax=Paenibacillus radicis (ex Xue et al. 2023) TaxID=2972489 RepID=A0ABT1YTN0_9BACL|nr:MFS transporter [Paenibacillus radicis (ex Xue et al. 2023)]MCR8636542.1 MFS transporter [Paenibacillus radicis (ex Xue et al. 2023)]